MRLSPIAILLAAAVGFAPSALAQSIRPKFNAGRSVTGVIRLSSGGVPSPPAEVYYCGRPVASTDRKGRFSFQLGGPGSGARGGLSAERCYISIQRPGSQTLRFEPGQLLAQAGPEGTVRLGVLVLDPLPGFQGSVTPATTLEAPKAALSAYQKGVREAAKSKPDLEKAAARFEQAVALHPRFAEAWTALGRARLRLQNLEGAMEALETAIAADPTYPAPYPILLSIRLERQEYRPAAIVAAASLRLNPADDQTRYYHALATFSLERYDEAAASARTLIDKGAGERFPQAYQILGEIQTERGDYPGAAENLRAYLQLAPNAPSTSRIRAQLANWESDGLIEPPITSIP